MLPQWHLTSETAIAPSESAYSQPSPPRSSALRPFSHVFYASLARSNQHRESRRFIPQTTPKSPTTTLSVGPPSILVVRDESFNIANTPSLTSRSPTSIRSVIDPGLSPPPHGGRPLSALTFSSTSGDSSPIQAPPPARVLDYGGNISLQSPITTSGRRFGLARNGTQGSSRSNRSHRSRRTRAERAGATGTTALNQRRGPRWVPKHSKGIILFPAMKNSAVRTKFFHALVSGGLLLIILIVFLALLSSNSAFTHEFRIIAILFMLVFAVLFVHSVIRLLMLMHRLKKRGALSRHPSLSDYSSYARPSRPIPVVLARDEELGIGGTPIIGSEDAPKPPPPPPPAYGLWRGSVRVDPNLIHWQRVEQSKTKENRPLSNGTIHLPPDYINNTEDLDTRINQSMWQDPNFPANDTRGTSMTIQSTPDSSATVELQLLPRTRYQGEA